MAQLIQAHNDSHIVSPGHAPNAPLIQASAPPPQQFRVTGDDPNARPDDRSVWNPQTNQWERGTAAIANQNARLSDERRGQMALEADMRRSLNTPIGVGGGRMPTQTELDELTGRVRAGANRKWAEVMGMPGAPASLPKGKSGVTFTGGGNPAEAATVDPMARWIEASAFLRDADGNIKEGWGDQAKWLEDQMRAEWGRRYGFENGASVAKEITGAQGARGNTPRLDEHLQSVGATPQGGETGTTAPATTEAGAPAAAPARKGKFRIAKADGSYVIEGEGDTFTETKNGETTTGRLDDLPVGSVQVTDGGSRNPAPAGSTPDGQPATPASANNAGGGNAPEGKESREEEIARIESSLPAAERLKRRDDRAGKAQQLRRDINRQEQQIERLRRRGKNDEADVLEQGLARDKESLRNSEQLEKLTNEGLLREFHRRRYELSHKIEAAQRAVDDAIANKNKPDEITRKQAQLAKAQAELDKYMEDKQDDIYRKEMMPVEVSTPASEVNARPLTEEEKREQEELDKMLMGE